jgi:hypothetical protein
MGAATSRAAHTHASVPVQHIDPDECALAHPQSVSTHGRLFSVVPDELRDLMAEVCAITHAKGRYDVVIAYCERLEAAPRSLDDVRRDLTDIRTHASFIDRL